MIEQTRLLPEIINTILHEKFEESIKPYWDRLVDCSNYIVDDANLYKKWFPAEVRDIIDTFVDDVLGWIEMFYFGDPVSRIEIGLHMQEGELEEWWYHLEEEYFESFYEYALDYCVTHKTESRSYTFAEYCKDYEPEDEDEEMSEDYLRDQYIQDVILCNYAGKYAYADHFTAIDCISFFLNHATEDEVEDLRNEIFHSYIEATKKAQS